MAVVLDRNGKFVSNLDRSQFSLTEDKVLETIRNFDPPSGHEMPPRSAGKMLVRSLMRRLRRRPLPGEPEKA